jgi:hypothetical protein
MNTTQKTTNRRNDSSVSSIKAPESKMSSAKTVRSTSTTASQTGSTRNNPSHDEIAARAYQIYLERGGTNGNDQDDWLRAEQELTGRK